MEQPLFIAQELELPGVLLIAPKLFPDERGCSATVFEPEAFKEFGIPAQFAQEFISRSRGRVIRGFHFQRPPYGQDKLVRVSHGEIWDVAADCDPASPTYGKWAAARLTANEANSMYIPGRYAHAYAVVSEEAVVEYKLGAPYHPESADGARYDDPLFAIPWPVKEPVLSEKDAAWPPLPQKP